MYDKHCFHENCFFNFSKSVAQSLWVLNINLTKSFVNSDPFFSSKNKHMN